jgi:hypothetical protein
MHLVWRIVPRSAICVYLCASVVSLVCAAQPLPIRRVMLYKHGVGYFERSGPTANVKEILLDFKAEEMSDVLKSLTLLDRGGGRVQGVSYEAFDPLEKQLENFAFSVGKEASLGQVLDQFKGAQVVVKTQQGELRGKILGARKVTRDKAEWEVLSLLLAGGEMRSVTITEAGEIRLEDPRLQRDLENYLSVVAGAQRKDRRTLRIAPGTAKELVVGYVVEAPVWKSSYRLVLGKPGEALLQGWAIVDNPTSEDWRDVELSLVSGLPISFRQNLYEPFYQQRPEVAVSSERAVTPPRHEGGVVGGVAGGIVGALAEMRREAPPPPRSRPTVTSMAETVEVAATGQTLGELFEYRVDRRIDIPRNQSAMIPFVQTPMKTERVLLYDPAAGRENPYDAVLLTNSSKLTLDGGAITVLDGDRYVGEALIETVKPADSRPVSFAVDLGTRVTTVFDSRVEEVHSIKALRGTLTAIAKHVQVKTYTARNTDGQAKTLIIQHPVQPGWKLSAGSPKPEETTARHYRLRLGLPAQASAKLTVTEEREISNTMSVTNVSAEMLAIYVRNKAASPEALKRLQEILALKDRVAETQKRINDRQQEITELGRDQDRLRQNLRDLRGIPGQEQQVNRYAAKLAEQEKTIEGLQTSLAADRAQVRIMQQDLDAKVQALEL